MANKFMTKKPGIHNGDRIVSSVDGSEKSEEPRGKRIKWDHVLYETHQWTQNTLKVWV